MSWIEKHAFAVLLRQESASIKDMRPIDIPANQFSYHLNHLIQQGYIEKRARSNYALTPSGLHVAGTFSTSTHQPRQNMKTVIILYSKTDDGRVSLFEWARQPYINKVTLPHDNVGYTVSLDDAIKTACIDKLGKVVEVTYKTNAFITISHQQNIVSRMHGLVYEFNPHAINYPQQTRNGQLFLAKPDECQNIMNGVDQFIEQIDNIQSPTPIEAELTY